MNGWVGGWVERRTNVVVGGDVVPGAGQRVVHGEAVAEEIQAVPWVGGWVGGLGARKVEENEAVQMSCLESMGGWMGG